MRHAKQFLAALGIFLLALSATSVSSAADKQIDFVRNIRPILVTHCYKCHGEEKQEGGLRLDVKVAALAGGDSGKIFTAGKPDESELLRRILTDDEDERMPPKGKRLGTEQIARVKSWIAAGAVWPDDGKRAVVKSDHWSFQPLTRPPVPKVKNAAAVQNALDAFVVFRLEKEGLTLSPQADRYTLLRRLYLDLTGLPPRPEEIESYVKDNDPHAYEKVVDRLLKSPHFGERWAMDWLDLARYADSDGYEKDLPRPHAYHWRDWLIDAINRDLPFDQFTVQQLAGDLLPGATDQTILATGFHRNTLTNREGGVDQEEFRVKAVIDRVNTTFTVWMGFTAGCAECHSHKYDPLSQREYYGLFSFFNNADERDLQLKPSAVQQAAFEQSLAGHKAKVKALQDQLAAMHKEFEKQLPELEKKLLAQRGGEKGGPAPQGLALHLPLDATSGGSVTDVISGKTVGAYKGSGAPQWIAGKHGRAAGLAGKGHFDLGGAFAFQRQKPFTYGAWIKMKGGGAVITKMDDAAAYRGVDLLASGGRVQVHIIHQWAGNAIKVETVGTIANNKWLHLMVTYDGGSKAGGVKVYVDGKSQKLKIHNDSLTGTIQTEQPLRVGARSKSLAFNGTIDDVRIYNRELAAVEVAAVAGDDSILRLVKTPHEKRTPAQIVQLIEFFQLQNDSSTKLKKQLAGLQAKPPKKTAVLGHAMTQRGSPRKTYIHVRGNFMEKGDEVRPHTPAFLPPLKSRGKSPDRLDLARWIVDPKNPLTSRVAVNHIWAHLFGRGLVKTSEDFGTQGEPPSHGQLLDHLAGEFVRLGWSRKALIKQIVTSNTYRQSSAVRRSAVEKDPENLLLGRQNRFRLKGEVIRDRYLAIGGLLNRQVGGRSFRPPLSASVSSVQFVNKWKPDSGDSLYRRGLYIHLQRNLMLPMLMTFDHPDAILSCTRRERSNTPLQALTLLNAPLFFESARTFGLQLATLPKAKIEDRIRRAYLLAVCREPDKFDISRVRQLHEQLKQIYTKDPEASKKLLGGNPPAGVALDEAAAWVAVARTIMNLDEVITRE